MAQSFADFIGGDDFSQLALMSQRIHTLESERDEWKVFFFIITEKKSFQDKKNSVWCVLGVCR